MWIIYAGCAAMMIFCYVMAFKNLIVAAKVLRKTLPYKLILLRASEEVLMGMMFFICGVLISVLKPKPFGFSVFETTIAFLALGVLCLDAWFMHLCQKRKMLRAEFDPYRKIRMQSCASLAVALLLLNFIYACV